MKNKPKVSTKYRDSQEKINRIIKLLKDHPEGLTPKSISFYTRINNNTVKSILPKIPNIKKKEGLRGIYVLVENNTHGSIFSWNLHNMILTYDLQDYDGPRVNKPIEIPLLKFHFGIGAKSKKATLHLSTDNPINISSLSIVASYFLELIKKDYDSPLNIDNVIVSSIEFNKDYINLRLDGLKSITLTSLSHQFKLYQKEQGLRQEQKINLPIQIPEIFSMLQKGDYTLDVYSELNDFKKKLEGIVDEIKRMKKILLPILNEKWGKI